MKSIDHFIQLLGYQASWLGIVRIAFWALLFLGLAGQMIPFRAPETLKHKNVEGLSITPMITLESDPFFVKDFPTDDKGKGYKIAWISDSSTILYKPGAKLIDLTAMEDHTLFAEKTLKSLQNSGLMNVHIDLFLRVSLRSLESYTLTKIALERDPDLVILSVSPVFIFNNHAVFKGDSHFARASSVWSGSPETWPWLFLFTSPSDHLWALFVQRLPVFTLAPAYAADVERIKRQLWSSFFPDLKLTSPHAKKDVMSENALVFWIVQRYLKGDISVLLNDKNETVNSKWYRQVIRLNSFEPSSINHTIMTKICEAIRKKGAKAIIYIEPASEAMRDDPGAWAVYQNVKETFRALRKEYGSKKFHFIIDVPPDVLKNAVYVKDDDIHFEQEGDFDLFLSQEISKLLSDEGADAHDR